MNTLRESISSISSGTLASLSQFATSSTTLSSQSVEDSLSKSQAIPNSLITEQWQVILNSDASIPDLENAISRCKDLVLNTDECSEERKWLVRHLVELRFSLKELQNCLDDPNETNLVNRVVLGHHFVVRDIPRIPHGRQHCDHCTGIIWTVVQSSYICTDCQYVVHHKCIDNVIRICAHVIASDRKLPIDEICPEIGLAAQKYKCAECQADLNFKSSWLDPRICDYNGLYYCPTCHWNDVSVIPARVIHNWDFSPRKVCRASLQEINLHLDKPIIKLEQRNPKLFAFIQKLSTIKKLRENLTVMRKYLAECRIVNETKMLDHHIGNRQSLIRSSDLYSITELMQVESGMLADYLNKLYDVFDTHIRSCELCHGKGYICEICGNNEVIFPYEDGCVPCTKCNSNYHRVCWTRKNMTCLKCIRLEERKKNNIGNDIETDEHN